MSYTYKHPHPAVTADIVIFSIIEEQLKLVLIKRALDPFKDCWALPGGFVKMEEDLEIAARRELAEETGIKGGNLASLPFIQIGAYGKPDRDPRERVITICFMTFVPEGWVNLIANTDAADVGWFPYDQLPDLAFDHARIIYDGRERLAGLVDTTISSEARDLFSFLPIEFTLAEAQSVFEVIKGEALDKRNFRKWISQQWTLRDLGKKTTGGRHRPAALFSIVE